MISARARVDYDVDYRVEGTTCNRSHGRHPVNKGETTIEAEIKRLPLTGSRESSMEAASVFGREQDVELVVTCGLGSSNLAVNIFYIGMIPPWSLASLPGRGSILSHAACRVQMQEAPK